MPNNNQPQQSLSLGKKLLYVFIGFAIAASCIYGYTKLSNKTIEVEDIVENEYSKNSPSSKKNKRSKQTESSDKIPSYVIEVLAYIEKNDEAPDGYVGGREFKNREKRLPLEFSYREWDVHPKKKGKNRGAERLVTSNKGAAYYTRDHYRTFAKIK